MMQMNHKLTDFTTEMGVTTPIIDERRESVEIRGLYYVCMYRQKFLLEATWYSKRNECTKMNGVRMLKISTKSRILAS